MMKTQRTFGTFASSNTQADASACKRAKFLPTHVKKLVYKFKFIDQNSDYLSEVIDLGNKHSKTLGFMPEGGFVDHARKKWIVIALKDDVVVGYLLFRLGKKNLKVSITHLCVKEGYRGQNIAFKLIDQLKEKYQNIQV